jgi:hypothetical protein
MSHSDQLENEAIAFSYDSLPVTIPSAEEIISSLSVLRGDLDNLSDLKSEEDEVVDALFGALMKLTRLLQWAPVEPSVLPVELGEVESAHVTPEGTLIYYGAGGEVRTIDLSDYDKRDVLVEVVRDLTPKLKEILENPPKVKEHVIEEPIPEPEPVIEEPVIEEPVVEEPAEEVDVGAEEPALEPETEEEPFVEEPQVPDEPEIDDEPEEQVIEEPVETPILELPPIEKAAVEETKPRKVEPESRNVDLLWAVLRGQRSDSLQEIREYRAKRERENGRLIKSLRKKKVYGLDDRRGFFDQLKDLFARRQKKEGKAGC